MHVVAGHTHVHKRIVCARGHCIVPRCFTASPPPLTCAFFNTQCNAQNNAISNNSNFWLPPLTWVFQTTCVLPLTGLSVCMSLFGPPPITLAPHTSLTLSYPHTKQINTPRNRPHCAACQSEWSWHHEPSLWSPALPAWVSAAAAAVQRDAPTAPATAATTGRVGCYAEQRNTRIRCGTGRANLGECHLLCCVGV